MIYLYCKIEYAVLNKLFHKNGSQAGAVQRNALQLIDFLFYSDLNEGSLFKNNRRERERKRERQEYLCLGTE